jgi:hypothetical protein
MTHKNLRVDPINSMIGLENKCIKNVQKNIHVTCLQAAKSNVS